MIRIGLVDLDTSHPAAFTRILRTFPGVDVQALWDGHDVWPEGYDAAFAREHAIPHVCTRLDEMPGFVDAVMIHGTNWDTHVDKAAVFLREKKPVLIDKPIVGTVRDCERLLNLQAQYGTPIYGGSSLRSASEVTALRAAIGGREQLSSVVASGPGDFFSYGIHTTEMLQGCVGTGIRSVRWIAEARVPILAVTYKDGLVALVHLQMQFHEWSISVYTDKGVRSTVIDPAALYEPFLKRYVDVLQGKTIDFSLDGPIEAVRLHIAAHLARQRGTDVALDSLPPGAGFDGGAFAAEYAAMKRQQAASSPQR